MGPLQHVSRSPEAQVPSCRPRVRECLLKGCGREFLPDCARRCYCSEACREAARVWSLREAQRRYRQSEKGRAARREQACRRRERQREREREQPRQPPESGPSDPPQNPRVGHQQETCEPPGEKIPCRRPGCYVEFRFSSRTPGRRFCSSLCHKAFRRAALRQRRWRGVCVGCPLRSADVCIPAARGP